MAATQPSRSQTRPAGADSFWRVVDLEEAGKFSQALDLFYREQLDQKYKDHATRIEMVRKADALATALLARQQFAASRDVLSAVQKKLDELDDRGLLSRIRSRLADIDSTAEDLANSNADALFRRAQELLDKDRFTEAAALYQQVVELKDPAAPTAGKIQYARAQKEHVEQKKVDTTTVGTWSQIWHSTRSGLMTIFSWILIGVPFLLAYALFRLVISHCPRKGARLELQDLTVATAEREGQSHLLTTELSLRLGAFGSPGTGAPELDGTPDLDSTGMPNVVIDRQSSAATIPLSTEAVKVGPFSFTPAQLWALAKQLFARPYAYELSGWLLSPDKGILLAVDNVCRRGDLAGHRWQCTADSIDGRTAAIQEMILKIAFEINRKNPLAVSTVWESFRAYYLARDLLYLARQSPDRKVKLEAGRNLLREAIQYDASNWVAWFYLATVLRKLGDNQAAADHFRHIITFLDSPTNSLHQFIEAHPDFRWTVWYNLAICLSKVVDWPSHRESVAILNGLVKSFE